MIINKIANWILLAIDIYLIIQHIHTEIINRSKNKNKLEIYYPTFRSIILMLILISFSILLILQNVNSRVSALIQINWTTISQGILKTLEISVLSVILGTILGLSAALILSIQKRKVLVSLIDSFLLSLIYILLGIPALVLLFFCTYYFNDKFFASVIALGINLSPFVAKIINASIRNISKEEIDSAISFGYNPLQIFWYFKFEYVLKNSIQSLFVEYYTTLKLSSLAAVFFLPEFYHATTDITTGTNETINSYIILAIGYVVIVTWIAVLADYLEHKWKPIHN